MIYTQIRAFDAVARERSFSRAAQALSLTQPAVTIQVKALEESFGVQLLRREGRGVTLTELGEKVFRMTRQLAHLEEQIRDTLATSNRFDGVTLRLAVDGPHIVMKLFSKFKSCHPDVNLAVSFGNTQFVRQELMERRADVAILPGIKGHLKIHAVPLWQHTAVVIVSKRHSWAGREDIALQELDGAAMVRREDGSMTQKKIDETFRKAGVKPRYVLEIGSREALVEAVGADLGCGILWDSEAQDAARFRVLPIRGVHIQSTDYIACLKSEDTRAVVRAFFDVASSLPGNLQGKHAKSCVP